MSHFVKFVTDGNEKADELAKAGAMLDEGFMAQARAKTFQQEREKKCLQPCSMQPAFTVWWRNGKTVKNSNHSRKKNGSLRTRKWWKQGIEWSGVPLLASTDV